jgi:nucleoid-associated protein YgaU
MSQNTILLGFLYRNLIEWPCRQCYNSITRLSSSQKGASMTEKKKGLFGLFGKKEEEVKKEVARKKDVAGTSTKADIDKAKADMLLKQKVLVKKKKVEVVKKHTVVSGETLSSISKKYYDDIGKYMKIYEANKDVIGGDPNVIKPGQVLVIPKL